MKTRPAVWKPFLVACCLASSVALAHPTAGWGARESTNRIQGVSSTGGSSPGGERGREWVEYLKNFLLRSAAIFRR